VLPLPESEPPTDQPRQYTGMANLARAFRYALNKLGSPDSSVGIVPELRSVKPGFPRWVSCRGRNVRFSTAFRPGLGPAQPSKNCALSSEGKRLENESVYKVEV